ncbi:MAG: SpoIIE family protein phosphatase [Pseudonocardia sp.]|nr:SpoIIE family protein phosphatase [Pseudonocardia sp.]
MERPDDLLADIVERLPIGVFALEPDGRVVLWNRHAERLTGWNRADLLGVRLLDAPVDVPSLTRIVDELRAGRPFTGRFPVRATSGPTSGPTLYLRAGRAHHPTGRPGTGRAAGRPRRAGGRRGVRAAGRPLGERPDRPGVLRPGAALPPRQRGRPRHRRRHHRGATMGQLRSMLRALADDGALPSLVVSRLDRVATRLGVTRFTTLVHGHLVRAPTGTVFRWSNAGHPPPVLVSPAGEPRFLVGDVGIVLGVAPDSPRRDGEVTIPLGSTLLLYTDGLVERRRDPENRAAADLLDLVSAHAHRSLGEFCDELVRGTSADTDDDIAVLAVRVT